MPTIGPNAGIAGDRSRRPAPLLISLPRGMIVSGITTWAVRLANALAASGRAVGLLVHRAGAEHRALRPQLHSGVRIFDFTGLPDLQAAAGDLSRFIPAYAGAVREMAAGTGGPVVISPNHLGDCYGICAALCLSEPSLVRIVGYQHLLIPYDTHVLAHYEPIISRFVGVSDAIVRTIRDTLPARTADIKNIGYGVEVPDTPPTRPALGSGRQCRPLRLIYTGRIEHEQKRVRALLELSRLLHGRGIAHRLTLLGDGPAAAEIDEACTRTEGRVVRMEPVEPQAVGPLLETHDVFVLASRAEGLSVSLLEAMARGCVPVVTRTPSGTEQAVDAGSNGFIAEAPPEGGDEAVGGILCAGVLSAVAAGLPALSRAAWETTGRKFSLASSAARTAQLVEECAESSPRAWPAHRPVAFTAAGAGGSGSVPPDGAARMRDLLRRLAGRTVVVHGTGRHSLELAEVLAESPVRVVAFTDDDPRMQGRTLWNWPVLAPAEAGRTGATDAVISSWMNQGAIWERRAVYERQGIVVHRLYEPTGTPSAGIGR